MASYRGIVGGALAALAAGALGIGVRQTFRERARPPSRAQSAPHAAARAEHGAALNDDFVERTGAPRAGRAARRVRSVRQEPGGAVRPPRAPRAVSPLVAAVTNPAQAARKRAAADELTGALTREDVAALREYLTDNPVGDADYLGEEYATRNYIMDALRAERGAWPEVVAALIAVQADPLQGDCMRGYALQHLASLHADHARDLPLAARRETLATLRAALAERRSGTLAATALAGLRDIAERDPAAVPPAEVARLAIGLLRDPASGDLTRIGALHVAGELDARDAGPDARRLAADREQDWVVRMAACWVLGRLGDAGELLGELAEDADENVRGAARAALRGRRH